MSNVQRDEYKGREYAIAWRDGALQSGESVAAVELETQNLGVLARRELAAAWAACGMFEFVALGYLGVSSALILFFAENLAHPVRLIGMQALVAAMILALCELRRGFLVVKSLVRWRKREQTRVSVLPWRRDFGIFGGIGIRIFSFCFALRSWGRWCIWCSRGGRMRN